MDFLWKKRYGSFPLFLVVPRSKIIISQACGRLALYACVTSLLCICGDIIVCLIRSLLPSGQKWNIYPYLNRQFVNAKVLSLVYSCFPKFGLPFTEFCTLKLLPGGNMEQRSSFLLVIMLIWLQASSTLSGTFRPPAEVHLEKKREEYPSNNERLESPETDRVSDW
jgi:hypothetical protein